MSDARSPGGDTPPREPMSINDRIAGFVSAGGRFLEAVRHVGTVEPSNLLEAVAVATLYEVVESWHRLGYVAGWVHDPDLRRFAYWLNKFAAAFSPCAGDAGYRCLAVGSGPDSHWRFDPWMPEDSVTVEVGCGHCRVDRVEHEPPPVMVTGEEYAAMGAALDELARSLKSAPELAAKTRPMGRDEVIRRLGKRSANWARLFEYMSTRERADVDDVMRHVYGAEDRADNTFKKMMTDVHKALDDLHVGVRFSKENGFIYSNAKDYCLRHPAE